MKRQGGFTLIELVVVIVILGILAVTAAPRFLNLQDDARASALQGLKGAIDGASGIVYGKAAIKSQETGENGAISVAGSTLQLDYGYPEATTEALKLAVDGIDSGDWELIADNSNKDPANMVYGIKGYSKSCVRYTAATGDNTPAKTEIVASSAVCTK
ncbi:type II secretion system protein [Vibrio sp. Vb2131]|uniref:type II secretion system protein n=1 Tax=Vibrio sp. Vb2131 TaxID=3074649 RepID=UPI0029651918|nr:type II secretion system protein [Vibrio sp. Vb2131]MDW1886444.1 type II secretion system protein [Vibrio sp. Vb2131]